MASLALYFNTNELVLMKTLSRVLRALGVTYVFDTAFTNSIALYLAYNEFKTRYLNHKKDKIKEYLKPSTPLEGEESKLSFEIEPDNNKRLPVLCSECPGWIVYAEKTLKELASPFISDCKSP